MSLRFLSASSLTLPDDDRDEWDSDPGHSILGAAPATGGRVEAAMCERITIEACTTGTDEAGLERVQDAYGRSIRIEGLRGSYMRDAEDSLREKGFGAETRICMGEIIRYTFVRGKAD